MDSTGKIAEIIEGVLEKKLDLQAETALGSIGVNSIHFVKIVVEMERAFSIEFEDEDLFIDRFRTVQDLCEYAEAKKPLSWEETK
ncbi:acyl carrier protein [Paenibacillus sp. GCM10027627]|uniref:acyl carrier protein n=1 Tax=unclassified Paenibacillus TaxID=185978 RepID=UPI0036387D4F